MLFQFLLHSLFIGERDRIIRVERAAKAIEQEGLSPEDAAAEQGIELNDLNKEEIERSRQQQFHRKPKSFNTGARLVKIEKLDDNTTKVTTKGGIAKGGTVRIIEGKPSTASKVKSALTQGQQPTPKLSNLESEDPLLSLSQRAGAKTGLFKNVQRSSTGLVSVTTPEGRTLGLQRGQVAISKDSKEVIPGQILFNVPQSATVDPVQIRSAKRQGQFTGKFARTQEEAEQIKFERRQAQKFEDVQERNKVSKSELSGFQRSVFTTSKQVGSRFGSLRTRESVTGLVPSSVGGAASEFTSSFFVKSAQTVSLAATPIQTGKSIVGTALVVGGALISEPLRSGKAAKSIAGSVARSAKQNPARFAGGLSSDLILSAGAGKVLGAGVKSVKRVAPVERFSFKVKTNQKSVKPDQPKTGLPDEPKLSSDDLFLKKLDESPKLAKDLSEGKIKVKDVFDKIDEDFAKTSNVDIDSTSLITPATESVKVTTFGVQLGGRGTPLISLVKKGSKEGGFTRSVVTGRSKLSASLSREGLVLEKNVPGRFGFSELTGPIAERISIPAAEFQSSLFKLTPGELSRQRAAGRLGLILQSDKGLVVRNPKFRFKDVPEKQSQQFGEIVESEVGKLSGSFIGRKNFFFGSVVDQNRLPSFFSSKTIGDLDVSLARSDSFISKKFIPGIVEKARKKGIDVSQGIDDPFSVQFGQDGVKVLEVKGKVPRPGEEALEGFRNVIFKDKTAKFGAARSITQGEQTARKLSASSFINPPVESPDLPKAFSEGGVFGKARVKDPRTLKDTAGAIQGAEGLINIRETGLISRFTKRRGTESAKSALEEFKGSFSKAQQKELQGFLKTATKSDFDFPFQTKRSLASSKSGQLKGSPTATKDLVRTGLVKRPSPVKGVDDSKSIPSVLSSSPKTKSERSVFTGSVSPGKSVSSPSVVASSFSPSPKPSPSPSGFSSPSPSLFSSPSPSLFSSPSASPSPSPFGGGSPVSTIISPIRNRIGGKQKNILTQDPILQPKAFTPSATALATGFKKESTVFGVVSGLGLRGSAPIKRVVKKSRKKKNR